MKIFRKIKAWCIKTIEPTRNGFDELFDELNDLDRNDPRNYAKIAGIYQRLCNGHAVVYKYAQAFYSSSRKSSEEIKSIRKRALEQSKLFDILRNEFIEKHLEHVKGNLA